MAENSKIEWTDHTFNPWIGCTAVSPACDNCYAEAMMDHRFGRVEWGAHGERKRTSAAYWKKPLAWNREAERTGIRRKVFCASLADVFDNHKSIDPQWRADLWELIANTPMLDWLLLTKRPQNIAKYLPDNWGAGAENVWLGTTVENQEEADRRIPHLLSVPAKVRFLSMEPLLGPVDLTNISTSSDGYKLRLNALTGIARHTWHNEFSGPGYDPGKTGMIDSYRPEINWVITGGESGKNARPSHPDWFRSIRDQCAAADVPFFMKQMSQAEMKFFKDFENFPADLQVRRIPS